ncbi:ATP-dependent RNA helicase DeaD [Gemmobacter megaterium]|uniref:ATP-dependent RNA helicase DeaD n=1 Tax=Gemmobacter megaterium TaxID=1086013 RepID=A0A1N7LLY2_9RHOB|nr:DEAD/DEAH box helicase [Gemmobacter megaterium]GGE11827.1 DEAD/DEAH box helicase [Gemmobacter megaterium]SIS74853.1 ATP-dependent RNA helicase DeaD [Gemmobacter megaterium]
MTETTLAAPLAAALADKGYETLTPVQQAVLAEDLAGRDLLVSAQTGSGKTVAFGLAIAPELLSGDLAVAGAPRALVVAPTRELALQVRREFEWLYGQAGAQIASCVGGMDWRTERRALDRGAAIVVGTPGRLRDHIEKGSLDLSDLRAVVLDEADEMLDLGFQEDLEFILSAAPETRRTLMFSATVPKAIEALASGYQRDAARVQVKGEARQHVDIAYRAMSVMARDKENAIINLLLLQQARVAIVFAKTRASVTHLHARMANRGFKVVALSGELSQGERTHALQALRDGRAQVCIATDVAARGIDLPGLDLVVHFDLPSNSETLLHRSGRTGRAGAKGTAVLVVAPADARKAQRLLQGAKVEAEWVKAPTADEVQAADDGRMLSADLLHDAITEDEAPLVEAILGSASPEAAAAGFLRLWRAGRSAPEIVGDLPPAEPREARPPRDKADFGPSVWYALSVGHEGRAEARWLLPKLCDGAGITRTDIGAIRVQQRETFVQIGEGAAPKLGASLELEPGLVATRMESAPDLDRPSAPRKPAYKAFDRPQGPARKSFGDRAESGDRKPYAPRPPRDAAEGDRRPYSPRPLMADRPQERSQSPRDEGDRKPWAKREDGDRKPYVKREDGDRKPYAKREDGDRKPYAKREDGDRKPYAKREDGDRKPYVKREDGERKPYAKREDGDRKPWVKREDSRGGSFAKREDAPRKPFAKREDGDRKPFAKREDSGPRSAAAKGADARPTRAAAPRPNFSDPSQSLRKPRSTGPKFGKPAPRGGFKPKR